MTKFLTEILVQHVQQPCVNFFCSSQLISNIILTWFDEQSKRINFSVNKFDQCFAYLFLGSTFTISSATGWTWSCLVIVSKIARRETVGMCVLTHVSITKITTLTSEQYSNIRIILLQLSRFSYLFIILSKSRNFQLLLEPNPSVCFRYRTSHNGQSNSL